MSSPINSILSSIIVVIFYLAIIIIEKGDSAEFKTAIDFGPLNQVSMVSTIGKEMPLCQIGDLHCLCDEARIAKHNMVDFVQNEFIPLKWTVEALDAPKVAYWRLQFYRKMMDGDFQDFGSDDSSLLEEEEGGGDKNFEKDMTISPVIQYFPGMYCIEMYGLSKDLQRITRSDVYMVKF